MFDTINNCITTTWFHLAIYWDVDDNHVIQCSRLFVDLTRLLQRVYIYINLLSLFKKKKSSKFQIKAY